MGAFFNYVSSDEHRDPATVFPVALTQTSATGTPACTLTAGDQANLPFTRVRGWAGLPALAVDMADGRFEIAVPADHSGRRSNGFCR